MDRRGQKTGVGYYDYDEARHAKPSALVEKIILDFAAKQGIKRRPIAADEILARCIYPMISSPKTTPATAKRAQRPARPKTGGGRAFSSCAE
jgi:hypothetical protein